MTSPHLIVIGTSMGGLNALSTVLAQLPAGFSTPIAVVQHRGINADRRLASLLQDRSRLRVLDAEDKMPLEAGHVYLAPPDYHLLIEERGLMALSTDPLVRSARPSIDVLFESAAQIYWSKTIGVILTGASADGADGLHAIKCTGGQVIVEDPATAESATMPSAALAMTPVAAVLPLARIGDYLAAITEGARV